MEELKSRIEGEKLASDENTEAAAVADPAGTFDSAAKEKEEKKHKKLEKMKKEKLCRLVKDDFLKKHFHEYQELVAEPAFLCGKCGRAAKEKTSLCKPAPIRQKTGKA